MEAISKIGKSEPITAHSAITASATSVEILATGFNACICHNVIAGATNGTWSVDIQGATMTGGTFVPIQDNNGTVLSTGDITASMAKLFVGLPDYIKVANTAQGTSSITTKIVLLNV